MCWLVNMFSVSVEHATSLIPTQQTTVEIRLSGLIGTASHPDMQKIRIIGFL